MKQKVRKNMAVNQNTAAVSLSLVANKGTDAEGKTLTATKTFAGVNKDATAEQMLTGAKAIYTLYSGTLEHVYSVTKAELTESSEG